MKTILDLLRKQPKKIKKDSLFVQIVNIYNSSNELKKLKISNYCFSLLNNARILAENLNAFYKRFNIPKNLFFPLFLKLKREYKIKQKNIKNEREKYIYERMLSLSFKTKEIIRFLNLLEKKLNKFRKTPIWNKMIYPKTKKRVSQYLKFNNIDWAVLFNNFLEELKERYKFKIEPDIKKMIHLFVLEIYDNKYNEELIIKNFRILSKKYHPDTGGNSKYFNMLKESKDNLLKKDKIAIK